MTASATAYKEFGLWIHALSAEQSAQLERAIEQFHSAQEMIRLVSQGPRELHLVGLGQRVDFADLVALPPPPIPEITVTGRPLTDNWFTHSAVDRALVNLADWEVAFARDAIAPTCAPDAFTLQSLALVSFILLTRAVDLSVLHPETTGCLLDLCINKPDRALKMRSGYLCEKCKDRAAAAGISPLEVDAVQSILERVRALALGRQLQPRLRPSPLEEDIAFVQRAALPTGTRLPGQLKQACRDGQLTVCVGSGLSLQADVKVEYRAELGWMHLPAWSEVPARLASRLARYRDRTQEPRRAESVHEMLTDMDFFRAALGERAYYPRAIFDIFAPVVRSSGRANRLLFSLPVRWILTTNYDLVLNVAAPAGTAVYTWREAQQAREYLQLAGGARTPLFKIHGCASRPDTIVLTHSEYERLQQSAEYKALMRHVFDVQTVLFLGFGLADPFDLDLAIGQAQLAGAAQGEKYALVPASREASIREKFPNVITIGYEKHGDLADIIAVLVRETTTPAS